jgi:YHS domain-containing protein
MLTKPFVPQFVLFIENPLFATRSTIQNAWSLRIFVKRRCFISLIGSPLMSSLAFAQRRGRTRGGDGDADRGQRPLRPQRVRDPVCGILVERDPRLAAEYRGGLYYFCSKTDRDKFTSNPEKYVQ